MPRKNRGPKERQFRPSACVACGEAAVGYNYDAPTCAACKSFFRRAVTTKLAPTGCVRNGACTDSESSGLCRPCRYDRCIKGGMNPQLVSCVEKQPKAASRESTYGDAKPPPPMSKIEATSISRHSKAAVECELEEDSGEPPFDPGPSSDAGKEIAIVPNPTRIELQFEKMMQNLLTLETAHHKLRVSKYTPRLEPGLRIDDFAFSFSKLGANFETMLSQAYEPISIRLMPVEVMINMRAVIDLTDFDYTIKKMWPFHDVVYSIEFMKALPFYHRLDDCSKKVLVGSALVSSNFTAAFYSYTKRSDRTCYPDGSVMTWSSELQEQSPESTRFHTRLIAAIREAQLDRREYTLLKMIIICNPLLDDLLPHDAAVLQQAKERCTRALVSYVLSRRGLTDGPAFFAKILSIVDVATKLTSWKKSSHILVMAMEYKNITPFGETIFHSQ